MAVLFLKLVFPLACSMSWGIGPSTSTVVVTQSPGEDDLPPQASPSGTVDAWRDSGSMEDMLVKSIIRYSVQSTGASSSSKPTEDERLLPSSTPSSPSPHPDPVTVHPGSPEPSFAEEMIDGLPVEEWKFRIAMFRIQLLQKLGLPDTPPTSQGPHRSLPQEILKRLIGREPQRDRPRYEPPASQITKVLSYAENDTTNCPGRSFCFRFRLVRDILGKPIKSVHLWMFVTPSHDTNRSYLRRITVWLLRAGESGTVRKALATKVISKKEGWFHLELPQEKHDWDSLEHRLQLASEATDASFESLSSFPEPSRLPPISLARDKLPILTVAVDVDKARNRLRRQTLDVCQAGEETCCLFPFQVDLVQVLGTHVVQPTTVMANFCRGDCFNVTNFETVHAMVMRDMAVRLTDDSMKDNMVPCCVPSSYGSDQSILIEHSNGSYSQHEISEISATGCRCR